MALPPGDLIAAEPSAAEDIQAVPVRHVGRWVAAVIVAVIAVSIIHSMASNPNFEWGVVGHYLFDPRITRGVVVTIELTLAAQALGVVLGVVLAIMRLSPNPLVSGGSWLYVFFFRGTPVLVQLLFWSFIGALYRTISIGIPFGPSFIHLNSNTLITGFLTVVLGLGLNEGAYMSEIVRAGIISVDEGQQEAASLARHEPPADDAPDRPAAGDARDHPADRQRDDLDAEDDLACPRRAVHRADDRGGRTSTPTTSRRSRC